MNENETQRSGRRRRGGRRRSKDRGERAETRSAPQQKQPTTLWQKIISFFTGKSKSGSAPQATPARKYPTYEPRQPRDLLRSGQAKAASRSNPARRA